MRTTVTLDPDAEDLIRRKMQDSGLTFKEALNDAIRKGLSPKSPPGGFMSPTFDLGIPTVNLDRALLLAGELEDEETIRKQRYGK